MSIFDRMKGIVIPRNQRERGGDNRFSSIATPGFRLDEITTDVTKSPVVESALLPILHGVGQGRLYVRNSASQIERVGHEAVGMVTGDIRDLAIRSAYYTGHGITAIVTYANRQPAKLTPLPWNSMKVAPVGDIFTGYNNYIYTPKTNSVNYGSPITLTDEEVIDFRLSPNPTDTRRGISPLTTLIDDLKMLGQIRIFTVSYLANMANPSMVIMPVVGSNKPGFTDPERKQIAQAIKDKYSANEAGTPLVSPIPLQIIELGGPGDRADMTRVALLPESHVLAVLGVPAKIAGSLVAKEISDNYASLTQMRLSFAENTVAPLQDRYAEVLTQQFLIPYYGTGLEFAWDNSENPLFRADEDLLWSRVGKAYNQDNLITHNEARGMVKQPLLTDGTGDLFAYQRGTANNVLDSELEDETAEPLDEAELEIEEIEDAEDSDG